MKKKNAVTERPRCSDLQTLDILQHDVPNTLVVSFDVCVRSAFPENNEQNQLHVQISLILVLLFIILLKYFELAFICF